MIIIIIMIITIIMIIAIIIMINIINNNNDNNSTNTYNSNSSNNNNNSNSNNNGNNNHKRLACFSFPPNRILSWAQGCEARFCRRFALPLHEKGPSNLMFWDIRDVVFEDVGFQT